MKFKVTIGDFLKHLQKTLPAVPPKSTVPVLEHLYFTVDDNSLRIIATDQDIIIQTNLYVVDTEPGSVLVPARKLVDIIKALDNQGEIEFDSNDETYDIIVRKGKGKYAMKGIDPDEFLDIPELFESETPILPDESDGTIDSGLPRAEFKKEDLIKLCDKTHYAVSIDTLRPAMMGVLFQFRETYVNAVSTDSFRLAKATIHSQNPVFPQEFDVIIPSKAIDYLRKIDNDAVMTVIEMYGKMTHLKFEIGSTTFLTRVIKEKFPPYETVIPTSNPLEAYIEKKAFLTSVKRVALFSNTFSKQIKLQFERNQVTISGEDEDNGTKGTEVVNCEFNEDSLTVAFNHKYIEDALNTVTDDDIDSGMIKISFLDTTKPSLIVPTNDKNELLILIMPVRI